MKLGPSIASLAILLSFASSARAEDTALQLQISDHIRITAPPNWRLNNQTPNSIEIYVPLQKQRAPAPVQAERNNPKPELIISSEAGMLITIEHRRNHAEAVRRLVDIAAEYPERVTPVIISGWPAIERHYRAPVPQPGRQEGDQGQILTSLYNDGRSGSRHRDSLRYHACSGCGP